MNSGLLGVPSHFSRPNNVVGQTLDLRQRWGDATLRTPPVFINVENKTSHASQLLLDLQVDSATQFSVGKAGVLAGKVQSLLFGLEAVTTTNLRATNGILQLGNSILLNAGNSTKGIVLYGPYPISWSTTQSTDAATLQNATDTYLARSAAATLQQGLADAAVAVAQTLKVQGVVAGTTNVAGANWTLSGSVGTGTGAGGQIILRTAPAGSTGTAQNALATGLTITAPAINMQPSVVVGNQAIATDATDGFLYIPTCAGTPTGTPTAHTGRVAMVFDTTNNKFYIYDGSWLGGTTPGAFV